MNIKELAGAALETAVAHRRYLHTHPELSTQEENTVKYIIAQLEELGIEYVNVPQGGVLGILGDKAKGQTVLLRADMDALPIQETENNLAGPRTCISENEGVMHACGHDAHTAMLLTAAGILKAHEGEIEGRIILCFERSEEVNSHYVNNLVIYMEENDLRYDTCFGLHVGLLPTGMIALSAGPKMAGLIPITYKVTGKGGHGSRPDESVNPIDCMMAIVNELDKVRLKKMPPEEQLTLSIGKFAAGSAFNIIPNEGELLGSARYFSEENVGIPLRAELARLGKACGELYGCEVENIPGYGPRPVHNNEICAGIAQKAITEALGEAALVDQPATMGSESFGVYTNLAPGAFGFVGIHTPEKGTGIGAHNPMFDIDEDALQYGVAALVGYAFEFLKEKREIPFNRYTGDLKDL